MATDTLQLRLVLTTSSIYRNLIWLNQHYEITFGAAVAAANPPRALPEKTVYRGMQSNVCLLRSFV